MQGGAMARRLAAIAQQVEVSRSRDIDGVSAALAAAPVKAGPAALPAGAFVAPPSPHAVKRAAPAPPAPTAQQQPQDVASALQKEDDAERKVTLRQLTHRPYNAETPNVTLKQSFYTPQKDFYVRSHLPMPHIDPATFKLELSGKGVSATFSLPELRAMGQVERPIVVQCGGNRRDEMNQLKETRGLKWKQGCIGNAMWQGVLLSDVLRKAGVDPAKDHPEHKHVVFVSADGYSVSVPVDMAFSRDCVMAWSMNGEPLTRAHGAPLRVVVPGVIGARSAKYVTKIRISPEEAQTPWQRADYKLLPPNVGFREMAKVFASTPPIMDMPVQSCILTPEDGDVLPDGAQTVSATGYAYSGGGRPIRRVDVSGDGGMTWMQATLHGPDGGTPFVTKDPQGTDWSWTFWSAEIPLPGQVAGGVHTICCKAVNTANDTQPETARGIWNVRGLCNNSWQQVRLRVPQDSSHAILAAAGEAARGAQLGEAAL
eukprot:TRINITY_DN4855_c0_g1_i1.p2 TRINITY_DN4855_c0_g1~~TRINITY_DN4855_c0_g1_i1.p2  ORF type:complete len:484 (+),score=131.50 TRINITY_DN4855_c0_g1_i1:78-1529(+)